LQALIATFDNGNFTPLDVVSNAERLELTKAIESLTLYEECFFLPASICWYNIEDYKKFYSWTEQTARDSIAEIHANISYIRANAAKCLMNVLTSFTSFDYITTARISALGNPQVMSEYTKITKSAFDEELAYRFLYKLCNFTKHCALPIAEVMIEDTFGPAETRKFNFRFRLSREKLLQYDSWGPVKKELLTFQEQFEVNQYIESLYPIIEGIQKNVIHLIKDQIVAAYTPVMGIYNRVRDKCNSPMIAWPQVDENGKTNLKMDLVNIPAGFLETLEKII